MVNAKNPEGEFLRGAGIEKHWVTSSGYMSCVSASGKYLGGPPTAAVLDEFRKLPEDERKPGAVAVRDMEPSERVIPAPPEGGLILKVHARFMSRDDKGLLRNAQADDFRSSFSFMLQPNTEYMWLTRAEWQALVPAHPVKGETIPVSSAVAERMVRFHLSPARALTSENGIVPKSAIKKANLELVVDNVTSEKIRMRLNGFVHWGSDYDASKATAPNGPLPFGFEAPLHGVVVYDRTKNAIVRFDVVAPGDVWGRWGDANGNSQGVERSGRNPIGFAFELADGASATNRLPPAGNGVRALRAGYFGAVK